VGARSPATREAPAGPAYLAIRDQGIAVIDETGSRLAVALDEDVMGMTLTPEGELLFTTIGGLFALRDGAAVRVGDDDAMGLATIESPGDLIADARGRLWVAGSTGTLTLKANGRWSPMPKESSGLELAFHRIGMVVDRQGALWLAADDFLYRQVGAEQKFEPVNVDLIAPETYERNFKQVAMTGDGTVVTLSGSAVYAHVAGTWKKAELGVHGGELLAANGAVVAAVAGVNLYRITSEGVKAVPAGKGSYVASDAFDLDVDAGGRAWLATDNGLVVVAPDGTARQWTPGTLPGVRGRNQASAVQGAGPARLPDAAEVIKGTIEGGFARAGKPMAALTIQMCEGPLRVFKDNPCERAVWRWKVVTGANGRFRFTDVPVGTYGLTSSECAAATVRGPTRCTVTPFKA
jgi:hypothetical protein